MAAKPCLWGILVVLVAGVLAACGGNATPEPTCGPQFCVTDARLLRPDEATIALAFYLTETDGTIDQTDPPTLVDGMTVTLADESGEQTFLDSTYFAEAEFTCLADTNVPGSEGALVAVCMIFFDSYLFDPAPATGAEILLSFSSPTFPGVLRNVTFP